MFCNKCGNELNDGAKFCPKCGASFQTTEKTKEKEKKKFHLGRFIVIACICILVGMVVCVVGGRNYATLQFENGQEVNISGITYRYNSENASVYVNGLENGELATTVTIPDTIRVEQKEYQVTAIGGDAFFDCTNLESITLPDGLKSIELQAFAGCTSLESISLPDSVTAIGRAAFAGCTSLESISLPDGVTTIEARAFFDCTSLESISLPDSVTAIEESAFWNCDSLKSINLPDSVTAIGERAFADCNNLKSINLPDSVTAIGESAFAGCKSLESINLPDGLTSIGSDIFEHCSPSLRIINSEKYPEVDFGVGGVGNSEYGKKNSEYEDFGDTNYK